MITDDQIKLMIGSLLHDIGKVVYRSGDGRNHSQSGYEYLKNEAHISDDEILNCVRYHHGMYLKNASLAEDDKAYVVYYADNVAAFSDRREAEAGEGGFDKAMPLESVFNILNGNHGQSHYAMQVLNPKNGINYPTEDEISMDEHFYQSVIQNITDNLKGITLDEEYINSLLAVLEANLTYIPSSTSKKELADISLYDHMKMTAAVASCVMQFLTAKGEKNYKQSLFIKAEKSYDEEMFLLYSMDISGIQSFIYTIGEKGALKGLRARSFYLEIMMEHIVDELLEKLSLSRANLIYTGGGHCYLLLANTDDTRDILEHYEKSLNHWMMEHFDTALYVACGYAKANANALRNMPKGSYSDLYLTISKMISEKKSNRYNADMIRNLNSRKHEGERECKVCRRIARLTDDKCQVCLALEKMSGSILYENYFTVMSEPDKDALPLPENRYLVADTKESLLKRMESENYAGKHVTTKLWVGDYTTGDTFEKLAEQAEGVERIGILRADVDNLGTTFVYGLQRPDGDDKYVTLSRTSTLSRQLSLFFKCYINEILRKGTADNFGGSGERKAVIVYSGGDDVFLAGAWNDVIAAFMDIRNALEKFTQGTLTISGGVGIYDAKYPLNVMAKEVERLEDRSKHVEGKNAVTLFDETHAYPWNVFIQNVVTEKIGVLKNYFDQNDEHGMGFLYHLMELLRESGNNINFARYVYLLSRMEPQEHENKEKRQFCPERKRAAYRSFSRKMYEWSGKEQDRKELITAIYLYVYLNRKREEQD